MKSRLLLASLGAFVVAGLAFAGTWETFRGPGARGVAEKQDLPINLDEPKNLLWKIALPGLGNSSPIVWNDQLFVQASTVDGSHRMLLCLDPKTGRKIWEKTFDGHKAHTHKKNSLASSTPACDGSAIYVAVWDGTDVILHALTMKGEPMWERNFGAFKSQHGPGVSPIVYKDKVIYPFDMDGKAHLYVLDKATGKDAWGTPRDWNRACYSAPQILTNGPNGDELIITSTTAITSYNPDTGSQNWNWTWTWSAKQKKIPGAEKPGLRTIATSLEQNGTMLASSGDGAGDRLTVGLKLPTAPGARPEQVWSNGKEFPYVPCLLTRGEHVYFVNDGGFAGCYEIKTGTKVWYERLPGATFTASPVMVDGKIYAGSEEGDIFVLAAEPKFHQLAQNQLGEQLRASPAVADGRLFVRGANHLFCFGKK